MIILTSLTTSSSKSRRRLFSSPHVFLLSILFCSMLHSGNAQAGPYSESGATQMLSGAACLIITPVYGAFKLAYAGLGALGGGLTWIFTGGDDRSAQKIWDSSMKGTYIITPEHLRGNKPINFVGPVYHQPNPYTPG